MNWGKSIVLTFIGFIAFILYFVWQAMMVEDNKHHMVEEEYYKTEIKYQQEIDKQQNTQNLSTPIAINVLEHAVEIVFPEEIDNSSLDGEILFYRPSNKELDFTIPITTENHRVLITKEKLLQGRWEIKMEFKANNQEFQYRKSLTI